MKLLSRYELVGKLISNKKFRDAFVSEHIKTGMPFQLRTMRDERGWTQGDLAKAVGKPRNVITRLEDPNYGKLTLRTLIEIASGLNVGLLVKFVPFTRLLREYEDLSPSGLSAPDIAKEIRALKVWAKEDHADSQSVVTQTPVFASIGANDSFAVFEALAAV